MQSEDYEYVALIDEAGDPGLRRVRPFDSSGSSEWLIVSAVVFRRAREAEAVSWGQELQTLCGNRHALQVHFAKLSAEKQKAACRQLASYPLRCFVACSNKKNMKGHRNPLAERASEGLLGEVPTYRWLYYWVTRVLLEKVTHYVHGRSIKEFGGPRGLKIIFSERGGIFYDELGAYYDLLRQHDVAETQFITYDQITWSVMRRDLLEAHPADSKVELSLPDIVASAFFAACDNQNRQRTFAAPARLLRPRLPCRQGRKQPNGYSVKLMPQWKLAALKPDQASIFKFYGYGWGDHR